MTAVPEPSDARVCGAVQHEPVPGQPHFCIRTPGHFPATPHGDYSGMEWTETEPPHEFVVP